MKTRRTWKRAAALAMASAMVFSMAGCGKGSEDAGSANGGSSAADKKEKTELTFWLTNEGENYDKVFQKFRETGGADLGIDIKLNWTTKHLEEMPLKLMNQETAT